MARKYRDPVGPDWRADETYARIRGGDRAAEAILLSNLGRVAILDGDYAGGRARCEEVLRLGRELGDDWTIGLALESLRMAAQSVGDLTEARALATECLRLFHGAPFPTGNALRALGQIDIAEGHYKNAREHLVRALRSPWSKWHFRSRPASRTADATSARSGRSRWARAH